MTPNTRRQLRQMAGETMREIGVLLIVFAPLDAFFTRGVLTGAGITVIVVGALIFVVVGMIMGLE